MVSTPIMPKASAVWLIDNTTLTFRQIADFCGLHELEVKGIADGEVAGGIRGSSPVESGELSADQLKAAEKDPKISLTLITPDLPVRAKGRKVRKYVPISRRQDRPSAISWLIRHYPDLKDTAIVRMIGTTRATVQAIRDRTHWNIDDINPVDPVALGICTQVEVDRVLLRELGTLKRPGEEDGAQEEQGEQRSGLSAASSQRGSDDEADSDPEELARRVFSRSEGGDQV